MVVAQAATQVEAIRATWFFWELGPGPSWQGKASELTTMLWTHLNDPQTEQCTPLDLDKCWRKIEIKPSVHLSCFPEAAPTVCTAPQGATVCKWKIIHAPSIHFLPLFLWGRLKWCTFTSVAALLLFPLQKRYWKTVFKWCFLMFRYWSDMKGPLVLF